MTWPPIPLGDGAVTIVGCGHRKWGDCYTIAATLEPLRAHYPLLTVIEGGQDGADLCVANWAADSRRRGVHWIHMPARWDLHASWTAGPLRNEQMCEQLVAARERGHGVLVVAFKVHLDPLLVHTPSKARGGTEDMIRDAWREDIDVWHCDRREVPPHLLERAQAPLF